MAENDGGVSPIDPPNPPDPPESASGDAGDDGKVYTAEDVKKLKDEAAQRRIKSNELEKKNVAITQRLLDREVSSTCVNLQDPSDLFAFVKAEDLMGEDGLPDEHKILQAEDDLLKLKPHLRSRKPRSTLEQGPRGDDQGSFSFNDWIKNAAG